MDEEFQASKMFQLQVTFGTQSTSYLVIWHLVHMALGHLALGSKIHRESRGWKGTSQKYFIVALRDV